MEVRPYVKAGVAVASAGALVAAMPAILPSPIPPDVRVSAAVPESVYADVALRATSQELFNAFFSGHPDTTGPRGAVGLALLFSDENFGEGSLPSTFVSDGFMGLADAFTAGDPVANAFVNGGIIGVAQVLVGPDPVAQVFLTDGIVGVTAALSAALFGADSVPTAFFAGGPNDTPGGVIGVADLLTNGNPLPNAFVTGGVIGVADLLTQDNPLANTFVNGGLVPTTEAVLVSATAADPVLSQGIQSFFSGYPFEDEENDAPTGPAGLVGLVHYVLDRLAGNPTQPEAPEDDPGAELLGGLQSAQDNVTTMLAASAKNVNVSVQDFSAAVRNALPAANDPIKPGDKSITVDVSAKTGAVDSEETDSATEETDSATEETDSATEETDPATEETDPATEETDPAAEETDPATEETDPATVDKTDPDQTDTPSTGATEPTTQPVAEKTPPVEETQEPAAKPAKPAEPVASEEGSEEGEGGQANKLTEEELNAGNKAEVPPILFQNGFGGGGGAWGQTVKRWNDAFKKLGISAPKAPKPKADDNAGGEGDSGGEGGDSGEGE